MMFCKKCGSIMKPKVVRDKKVLACSCGYIHAPESKLTFTEKSQKDDIDVIDHEQSAYPVVEEECPQCKNDKAYSWTQQMRAGDEPETHFFKCTKCNHTWREY